MKIGMIQCYYGNGKGKTSAAVGCAIRAAGADMRVLFVQFFKNGDSSEIAILKSTKGIDVLLPNDEYVMFEKSDNETVSERKKAYTELLFERIPKILPNYEMLILDEVLDAVEFGYLEESRFVEFLKQRPESFETVLSGHNLSAKVAETADYISEIKEIRHPYKKGALPRKGIEF